LPHLAEIVADPKKSDKDRRVAAEAIGSIGSTTGFEILSELVRDGDDAASVRRGAIRGLGDLRYSRGYELLLDIFKDRTEGDDERACAAEALLKIDPDLGESETTLVAIDESERPYLRFWTAVFLVKATDGSVADVGVVEALKCYRFERRRLVIDSTWEAAFDALLAVSENGRTPQVRSLARKELSTMHELLPDEFEWNGQVVSSTQDSLKMLAQHKDVWRIACCGYYLVVALLWFPLHRRVVNARRGTVYSILILAILAAVGTPLVLLAI
jgi:HEAT repeat protein